VHNATELERALKELPIEEKWEIAQWLLDELHSASRKSPQLTSDGQLPPIEHPNYASRRRKILGNQVVQNMVIESRAEDPW
jgi:hypothetical protein